MLNLPSVRITSGHVVGVFIGLVIVLLFALFGVMFYAIAISTTQELPKHEVAAGQLVCLDGYTFTLSEDRLIPKFRQSEDGGGVAVPCQ